MKDADVQRMFRQLDLILNFQTETPPRNEFAETRRRS